MVPDISNVPALIAIVELTSLVPDSKSVPKPVLEKPVARPVPLQVLSSPSIKEAEMVSVAPSDTEKLTPLPPWPLKISAEPLMVESAVAVTVSDNVHATESDKSFDVMPPVEVSVPPFNVRLPILLMKFPPLVMVPPD